MKFLITLCLFASLATIAWTSSANWGTPTISKELYTTNTVVTATQGSVSLEIKYFPSDTNITIEAVQLLDRYLDGKGAYHRLIAGGPGENYAVIRLDSQPGIGINTLVRIYGH